MWFGNAEKEKIHLVRLKFLAPVLILAAGLWGCAVDPPPDPTRVVEEPESLVEQESSSVAAEDPASGSDQESMESGTNDAESQPDPGFVADVIKVVVSGDAGAYQFSVTIRSPDTGCEQYADWWEVLDQDGNLLYRRILTHSHASEQPFTRSGGPVVVSADQVVIVRAHMYPLGYGGAALEGSVASRFAAVELPPGFAAELGQAEPLPAGCDF